MGGYASSGRNNDELVSNLCTDGLIKCDKIEKIFRAVDRGHYFLEGDNSNAYNDLAWKNENFHISAPCIYSEALRAFNVTPGKSFLNIGSGTGYLSTMMGLLLGVNGINHGIELYEEVVEHAKTKLESFKKIAPHFDWYDFCEPTFVTGNCLHISSDNLKYDLVYCGAECPDEHLDFIKSLLNVNGILVIPHHDLLKKIVRVGNDDYEEKNLLEVTFATLVVGPPTDYKNICLPKRQPPSLKSCCRSLIRGVLREKHLKPFETLAKGTTSEEGDEGEGESLNNDEMVFFGNRERLYLRHIMEPEGRLPLAPSSDSDSDDDDEYDDSDDDGDADVMNLHPINALLGHDDIDAVDAMENHFALQEELYPMNPLLDHNYVTASSQSDDDDDSDRSSDISGVELPALEHFSTGPPDDTFDGIPDLNEFFGASAERKDKAKAATNPSVPSCSTASSPPSSSSGRGRGRRGRAGCSAAAAAASKNPRNRRRSLGRRAKRRRFGGARNFLRPRSEGEYSSDSPDSDDEEYAAHGPVLASFLQQRPEMPGNDRRDRVRAGEPMQPRMVEEEEELSSSSAGQSFCTSDEEEAEQQRPPPPPPLVADTSDFYQAIEQLPIPSLLHKYLAYGRTS